MDFGPRAIRALIEGGEGREVEFKSGLPRPEKTARTLCAFANTRGGVLLIGVDDQARVLGAGKARSLPAVLREIAQEWVEPPLRVLTGLVQLEEGAVVYCSVPLSPERPHAVRCEESARAIVVRVGSSNRVAEGATLRALLAPRARPKGLDPLAKRVLEWVSQRTRRNSRPGGDATVVAFAEAQNIGRQRAKRCFIALERAGLLLGHGTGPSRAYFLP